MIPGAVHSSPGIYLKADENPGHLSYETVYEGCANGCCLKWGPLPPNEVGRFAQHVRKEVGKKEGNDEVTKVIKIKDNSDHKSKQISAGF